MKEAAWMAGVSVVSCLAVALVVGRQTGPEIVAGMLGPLLAAGGSWVVAERTFSRRPERLTAVMVTAFGVKIVFFGGYVAVVLGVMKLRAVPFMASFTSYFVALYATEALCLRGLIQSKAGSHAS